VGDLVYYFDVSNNKIRRGIISNTGYKKVIDYVGRGDGVILRYQYIEIKFSTSSKKVYHGEEYLLSKSIEEFLD
jgi:hypothetical protein